MCSPLAMDARRNFHMEGERSKKYPPYGKYMPPHLEKGAPVREKVAKGPPHGQKVAKMDNICFVIFQGGGGGRGERHLYPPPPSAGAHTFIVDYLNF